MAGLTFAQTPSPLSCASVTAHPLHSSPSSRSTFSMMSFGVNVVGVLNILKRLANGNPQNQHWNLMQAGQARGE